MKGSARSLGSPGLKAIYLLNAIVLLALVASTALAVIGLCTAILEGKEPLSIPALVVVGLFLFLVLGLIASGLPYVLARAHRYRLEVTEEYDVEELRKQGLSITRKRVLGLLHCYCIEAGNATVEVIPVALYTHRLRDKGLLPSRRILLHLVPRKISPEDYKQLKEAITRARTS